MFFKILIPLIVIFVLFFLVKKRNGNKKEQKVVEALEMKQDPICGSYVEEITDHKVKLYDDIYYFCSDECKQKFVNSKKDGSNN